MIDWEIVLYDEEDGCGLYYLEQLFQDFIFPETAPEKICWTRSSNEKAWIACVKQ